MADRIRVTSAMPPSIRRRRACRDRAAACNFESSRDSAILPDRPGALSTVLADRDNRQAMIASEGGRRSEMSVQLATRGVPEARAWRFIEAAPVALAFVLVTLPFAPAVPLAAADEPSQTRSADADADATIQSFVSKYCAACHDAQA